MSTGRIRRLVPALVLATAVALGGCGEDQKTGPGHLIIRMFL